MDDSNRIAYFLCGLGVGVAVGVLFAPKSGEDTRRYLLEKSDEGREYMKRRSEDLRGQASGLVDRGKGAVARQKEQLDAAISAGKQAYREAVGTPAETGDATAE